MLKDVFICLLLALATPFQAQARSSNPRAEKPVSVMAEVGLGGSNGTLGLALGYDFNDWVGTTVGGGYSVFSDAVLASAMLNLHVIRGKNNSGAESSLMLSLGSGFRGSAESTRQGWLGDDDVITSSDYSIWLNSAAAYAYATQSGMRLRVYLGYNHPLHVENHVETNQSGHVLSSPSSPKGTMSLGVQFGAAF